MNPLTSAERRALRARAHALHPVATIGQHGLTPAVLHEIDVALLAHELIKIRVFGDDRAVRESLYARICAELHAAPVQHIGKLIIVWRPAPEPEPAAPRPAVRQDPGAPRRAARPARGKPPPGAGATDARRRGPEAGPAAVPTQRRRGSPHGQATPATRGPRQTRRRRAP